MNYKDMDIKRSYISCGEDGIADALIIPALKCTNHYCRSVGYFSSGVFETIMDGIPTFVRNGGDIKMIASPKLNDEDIDAINLGYEEKVKKTVLMTKWKNLIRYGMARISLLKYMNTKSQHESICFRLWNAGVIYESKVTQGLN